MVNESLLAAKLVELRDRIERVRCHAPVSPEELASNRDMLDSS